MKIRWWEKLTFREANIVCLTLGIKGKQKQGTMQIGSEFSISTQKKQIRRRP